ncbi:MAG TPA: ester cyclase [Pirellulales bacterium]|jgi:steroid delta-isomerase-like uncharacterized protein
MEKRLTDERVQARIRIVEEHVRLENLHDLRGILATFGQDAQYDDEPWSDHRRGSDQVHLYYQQLLTAAPDLKIEVRNRYVTEEAIVLEVTISGTHNGPWRGLPATGRLINFPLCGIYTFDSQDRLAGEKIYYDRATVLRQLGMFREPSGFIGRLLTGVNHPWTIAGAVTRKILGHRTVRRGF